MHLPCLEVSELCIPAAALLSTAVSEPEIAYYTCKLHLIPPLHKHDDSAQGLSTINHSYCESYVQCVMYMGTAPATPSSEIKHARSLANVASRVSIDSSHHSSCKWHRLFSRLRKLCLLTPFGLSDALSDIASNRGQLDAVIAHRRQAVQCLCMCVQDGSVAAWRGATMRNRHGTICIVSS